MGDFQCDNCDFSGTWSECSAHEQTCTAVASSQSPPAQVGSVDDAAADDADWACSGIGCQFHGDYSAVERHEISCPLLDRSQPAPTPDASDGRGMYPHGEEDQYGGRCFGVDGELFYCPRRYAPAALLGRGAYGLVCSAQVRER